MCITGVGRRVAQQRRRQLLALTALALPVLPLGALPGAADAQTVLPGSQPGSGGTATVAPVGGPMTLKVRRLPDAVEVRIEGVGETPQLQQSTRGPAWEGLLFTGRPTSLRSGPQRIGLPEAGFASISLDGAGSGYRIMVTPLQGAAVPRPVVSADGRDLILSFAVPTNPQLQTATPSLTTPGRVSDPSFVPPLQPRATAPPVGDIAVGTMMLANPSYLNVSGPPVTMTLRNAPAKDVLMALSQLGGYGFVYVDEASKAGDTTAASSSNRTISIAFRNENYARALNATLLAAGLQGKREGNMLMVGTSMLNKTFGTTMSKVFRLNQVSAAAAAEYLANLGATVTKVNTITTAVTQGADQTSSIAGAPNAATTQASTTTTVESYGASQGPLKGLLGTTDSRLGTITLVGDPRVVAIAEGYLRQLDLRQRQVALSVKILDVTLSDDTSIDNSFAFRSGNSFIVNEDGRLSAYFGGFQPSISSNPKPNPGTAYPTNQIYDYLTAQIESKSTKVLASPTLILGENAEAIASGAAVGLGGSGSSSSSSDSGSSGGGSGDSSSFALNNATIGRPFANEAFVIVGTQVITSYKIVQGANQTGNSCEPQFGTSGLTFGARVSKIDDNGYVTFTISPTVSATSSAERIPKCGPVNILNIRRLDTGTLRVRDGQTLVLTGVISDADINTVTKWPILGDIPFVGQFFRSSGRSRQKNELVIMVTPRILRDDQGGAYGYGYQPSIPQTRDFLRQAGG